MLVAGHSEHMTPHLGICVGIPGSVDCVKTATKQASLGSSVNVLAASPHDNPPLLQYLQIYGCQ